jgi:hypothetical protein
LRSIIRRLEKLGLLVKLEVHLGGRDRNQEPAYMKRATTIFVDYGHLAKRDPNYGLRLECFVCDAPHAASGIARIRHDESTDYVPLCETCREGAPGPFIGNAIVRKFFDAPGMEIHEGGEATTEQVLAVAEKLDATEH